jgi:hypothetical protein
MARSRSAPRSASSASSRPRPAASPPPPAARPASHSPPPPAPASYASAPPPAMPQQSSGGGGGMMSGLMGAVVQGAAMGTGSAIAHRAVDSFMGPRGGSAEAAPAPAAPVPAAYQAPAEGACGAPIKAFAECMSRTHGDMGGCQSYFEAMQSCKSMNA